MMLFGLPRYKNNQSKTKSVMNYSIILCFEHQALREVRLNPLQLLMKISQTAFCICVPLWLFIDTPTMSSAEDLVCEFINISHLHKVVPSINSLALYTQVYSGP